MSLNASLLAFVRQGLKHAAHLDLSTAQGRWKRSDHSDLGHSENFAIYGQSLIFQNFGRTNNCAVEVLLKWSDQSRTPSPAPAIKAFKGSQHQVILASVRCNNLVTTLMCDITGGWGCFWCMDAYVWVSGGVPACSFSLWGS